MNRPIVEAVKAEGDNWRNYLDFGIDENDKIGNAYYRQKEYDAGFSDWFDMKFYLVYGFHNSVENEAI